MTDLNNILFHTSRVELTTSGNFIVPAGVTKLKVSGCGGGGGGTSGGSEGGGGGAGAALYTYIINVISGESIAYTIGAGGAGGISGGPDIIAGTNGLNSTFANAIFTGGDGQQSVAYPDHGIGIDGGADGGFAGADVGGVTQFSTYSGGAAGTGQGAYPGSGGGAGPFGNGADGGDASTVGASAGVNTGAGGGGGGNTNNGGAGGSGRLFVEYILP